MEVMPTPRSVDIAITSRCNLKCSYCSHFTGPGDVNRDLPATEWEQFFKQLRACAVLNVTIGGGEPFIRDDLPDIIEGIVRNNMRYTILTNGTLIDDEKARFLSDIKRCDSVQISIDGAEPSAHDVARGVGAFHRALSGLEKLRKYEVPVSVRVTIHHHNVNNLQEIAHFILEDLGLKSFSTNSAAYLGKCRVNADQLQLTVDEYTDAMAVLLDLKNRYNGRINAAAGPLAEATMWLNMERWREKGKNAVSGRGYLSSCGGVFSQIAIRSDGVLTPCNQMGHIKLGRILEDDVGTVWRDHAKLKDLRERRKIPLGKFNFCRRCVYIPYCTGGCPAEAYTVTGNENHPNPASCLRRFLERGGALPSYVI